METSHSNTSLRATSNRLAQQRHAGDGLQRPLLRRFRFQPRLMPGVRPFVPMPAFRAPSCRPASADFCASHRAWFSGSVGRAPPGPNRRAPLDPLAAARTQASSVFSSTAPAAVASRAPRRPCSCKRHRLTWRFRGTLRDKAAQRP